MGSSCNTGGNRHMPSARLRSHKFHHEKNPGKFDAYLLSYPEGALELRVECTYFGGLI